MIRNLTRNCFVRAAVAIIVLYLAMAACIGFGSGQWKAPDIVDNVKSWPTEFNTWYQDWFNKERSSYNVDPYATVTPIPYPTPEGGE